MFGTHDAKYRLKKWVEDHQIERIERFTQSIGDAAFSEIELALPGDTVEAQVAALSDAFVQFTGAPLAGPLLDRLRAVTAPQFALALRIRGGTVARIGALIPGVAMADVERLCADARVQLDPGLAKLVGALGGGVARVEYGRAGDRAGVDVYIEPGEPPAVQAAPASSSQAN
jgi:hypothetical protein